MTKAVVRRGFVVATATASALITVTTTTATIITTTIAASSSSFFGNLHGCHCYQTEAFSFFFFPQRRVVVHSNTLPTRLGFKFFHNKSNNRRNNKRSSDCSFPYSPWPQHSHSQTESSDDDIAVTVTLGNDVNDCRSTSSLVFTDSINREEEIDDDDGEEEILYQELNNTPFMDNKHLSSTTTTTTSPSPPLSAILILLTVPAAWGTYAPAVKYIYDVSQNSSSEDIIITQHPLSMPGLVFSAGYYAVAAITLTMLLYWKDHSPLMEMEEVPYYVEDMSITSVDQNQKKLQASNQGEKNESEFHYASRGGWELGSYLFVGNAFQVAGLQTVPADRAAFLVQLTTVIVPLLSAFSAGKLSAVSMKTWVACVIAFTGVVIMGFDSDDSRGEISTLIDPTRRISEDGDANEFLSQLLHSMSGGDILIIFAALAYSLHVLRLGAYAPRTSPLRLAAAKAKAETVFSVSVVLFLAYIGGEGHVLTLPDFIIKSSKDISSYISWLASSSRHELDSIVPSIGAILWTGWVTCAYTIYAQSYGQRRVNATDANLIYATQPLFTSLFAYFLLGETLGSNGYVGAVLIGIAVWLVSK